MDDDEDYDDDDDKIMTVFHYTDKKGRDGIVESGYIKQSDPGSPNDDATFGIGTYVTGMSPDKGKPAIAENIFDGVSGAFAQQQMEAGKVDHVFKLEIPESELLTEDAGGRDVRRYMGDIHLKDYEHSVHEVEDETKK